MDILLTHLQNTAEQRHLGRHPQALLAFINRFRFGQPVEAAHGNLGADWERYPPALLLSTMQQLLKEDHFEILQSDAARGVITARFQGEYHCNQGWFATIALRSERIQLYFEVYIAVDTQSRIQLTANAPLDSWVEQFKQRLQEQLARTPAALRQAAEEMHSTMHKGTRSSTRGKGRHTVLAPGEELDGPFVGNLQDYSGCATAEELQNLRRNDSARVNDPHVLPLGRWAFQRPATQVQHGASLYLSTYRTRALMMYNGILLCAPQNSGKTRLVVRWAQAANQAGYSTLLVDVKGKLYQELATGLKGKVYYFSTNADEVCDRMNFLAGLELYNHHDTASEPDHAAEVRLLECDPKQSRNIRQLVAALLPGEGWEKGEHLFYYQNRASWLTAMIHILKLREFYYPESFSEGHRGADLSDLYDLVSNEESLSICIEDIKNMEDYRRTYGGDLLEPGIAYWVNEISLLLPPHGVPEDLPRGQRRPEDTYRSLTQGLVMALQPFSRYGTLYRKIRDIPTRPEDAQGQVFAFEDLGAPEQVTIILAAREQDLEDSVTVISLAVKKLQQFLFERFGKQSLQPILLLLDETRRIRAFNPGEYITFAREAQAGCVLVYQSLDQIGKEQDIVEILENVGTQIYLGSLVGNTARYFINILPKRFRPTYTRSSSMSTDGHSSAMQSGQELVDYFTTNELYTLPAGEWPALVYIKDHSSRKPFLVDMDEALTGAIYATASQPTP